MRDSLGARPPLQPDGVKDDYDDIPPLFALDDEHVLAAAELREAIADLLAQQTALHVAEPPSLETAIPICCRTAPNTFCRGTRARTGRSTRCTAKAASCGRKCGIAALLANGQHPAEPVSEAQGHLYQAFSNTMGAYMPDRLCGAHSSEEDTPFAIGKEAPPGEVRH